MIGIRGAITINEDTSAMVREATVELMKSLIKNNNLVEEKIVSIFITATKDIHSAYPGKYIREDLKLNQVPMLHAQEMDVEGALSHCIRILIHYKDSLSPNHQYLRDANVLRPDWLKK